MTLINIDGGCRNEVMGIGYSISNFEKKISIEYAEVLESAGTNNQAEYSALLYALRKCRELDLLDISVQSDSQLLVNQLLGKYKVRSENLIKIYNLCKDELKHFNVTLTHIPREQNTKVDSLINNEFTRKRINV